MRTVMLVDDERPARELLKILIDWNKAGFEILWEARNGKQALEQYTEKRPDLIITDIQMPVMDGLELLKNIKRICPSQKIVILSCHENFSYAKQALKYGVMDYLIKDALTDEVLYNLLKQVKEEDIAEASPSQPSPVDSDILSGLLSGDAAQKEQAVHSLDAFIRKGMDYFCCACKLESFTGLPAEWQFLAAEVQRCLNELDGGDVCLYRSHCLMVLCIMKHHNSKMDAFNNRFLNLRHIRQKLQFLTGCSVSIGVSSQSGVPEQLERLCSEALQALDSKVFQGTGKTLYYVPQYNKNQQFQINTLNQQFQNIRTAVENSDEALLRKELLQVYNKGFYGITHYNYLNYVNAILLDILMDTCRKRNIPYEIVFETEDLALDVFDKMNTVDNIYQWFHDRFFRLFRATSTDSASYSPRVRKITEYIRNNFQQDISLESIADTFWIHKVYLAKLFKQETGTSVNEYIRSLRIEKAKELLLKDNIRINEIVTATGFNNPQSFYTLFKKYVGMKPGEYREYALNHRLDSR